MPGGWLLKRVVCARIRFAWPGGALLWSFGYRHRHLNLAMDN